MDPEGVWDEGMIGVMLPVALEVQADQAQTLFGATAAALAGLFAKEAPEAFLKGIEKIRAQVREKQFEIRGIKDPSKPDPADQFVQMMQQIAGKKPRKRYRAGDKPGKGG